MIRKNPYTTVYHKYHNPDANRDHHTFSLSHNFLQLRILQDSTVLNRDIKYDFDYHDTNGIISNSLNHDECARLSQLQP